MTKRIIDAPDLDAFSNAGQARGNQLLLDWLSDDEHRLTFYTLVNAGNGSFNFFSRDASPREGESKGFQHAWMPPEPGHKEVELITDRKRIIEILQDQGEHYSNRIYAELGGGSFMLALDPKQAMAHAKQRAAFKDCFPHQAAPLADLCHRACRAAAITALRAADFDLARFAEQSAVRFCQKLLGYGLADFVLLENGLRSAYAGLVYQVFGRHFVTDPVVIVESKQAMGRLLRRTSALIDAYGLKDEDFLKVCEDTDIPDGFVPVMQKLGEHGGDLNGEQRAIIALGAAVGTVGNVQAAACIAVKALFASTVTRDLEKGQAGQALSVDDHSLWAQARKLARAESASHATKQGDRWKQLIQGLLRQHPPIPFLPRWKVGKDGKKACELLLALGGATLQHDVDDDPLIWGLPHVGTHWCAGQALAWPLIIEIVRQVMALPGLDQRLDAEDGTVIGLKKRWGFACESYPLTHRRDRRVAQASLNVAMRLKSPVKDSADRVRDVIRAGAPRIEQALRESRHVHFAWFELIDSDTVLVLHTVYDGPFEAYIQDFALKVGVLFDLLFEWIEDAPPAPVDKFPNEFVAHIQRYDRKPAMGYFFSAYPSSDVARIIRDELARP